MTSIPDGDANQSETKEETTEQPEPSRNSPPTLSPNLQGMDLAGLSQDQKDKAM